MKRLTDSQKKLRKEAREWGFIVRHEIFESVEAYPPSAALAGEWAQKSAHLAFTAHPELREEEKA